MRYLPKTGNSVIIHWRNLKILATKIFKKKNDLNTKVMDKVYQFDIFFYKLRSRETFKQINVKVVIYTTETSKNLA